MKYLDGNTLAAHLRDRGVLREDDLRSLLWPLLEGLSAVHNANYLHRDLKPANIMVGRDGSPVILDFGAARQALSTRSQSVTSLVTPGYAPIEQYASTGNQGPWTDIYALGAVAYRALTGRSPIAAPERLLDDGLAGWTASVHGATPEFLNAIDRSLAMKANERPQTVAEWKRMLGPPPCLATANTTILQCSGRPAKHQVRVVAGKALPFLGCLRARRADEGTKLQRLLQSILLAWRDRFVLAAASIPGHAQRLLKEAGWIGEVARWILEGPVGTPKIHLPDCAYLSRRGHGFAKLACMGAHGHGGSEHRHRPKLS